MLLVATVIGSGIMAERLAGGNDAVALLGNTAATGAVLYVLIALLGPISGAQFNPAVTLMLGARSRAAVIAVQILAAVAGTVLAHLMFGHAALEIGAKARTGPAIWLGEFVATFGLLLTIRLGLRYRAESVPALVAAWIVAGYWFTSSTSFANPAVTLARALTDSFAGIRMIDVPAFVLAQLAGAFAGYHVSGWLTAEEQRP
ncbi:aquaporin [Sphingomonas sp. SUN039]|uniref:aquaporin n=1 Tax=Sphingomonas sp. SUN039 TaxID=2937787 RepID=UPI0021647090|nr:aquaporin [Sphingomonas sp. SUN039]UVO55880.1 aquaporin [Sphingomonas sp. SUN039]